MREIVDDAVPAKGGWGRRGMPDELAAGIIAAYQRLGSGIKVGKLFKRSPQSILAFLKRRGLTNPRKRCALRVEHNGEIFTPVQEGYLQSTRGRENGRGRAARMLHRVVWEEHHGPIPPGHQIMFRDGNRWNCAIKNLVCKTKREARCGVYIGNGFTKWQQRRDELLSDWLTFAFSSTDAAAIQKKREAFQAHDKARPIMTSESRRRKSVAWWENKTPEERAEFGRQISTAKIRKRQQRIQLAEAA